MYDAPGRADELDGDLRAAWNALIREEYASLEDEHGSRFFTIDPDDLESQGGTDRVIVAWFAHPSEPEHCLGNLRARRLSDRGSASRQMLHNEYCEYVVVRTRDDDGSMRPKRVEITTELAEYWRTLAIQAPDTLRNSAEDVLGVEPSWGDLYGVDPSGLDEEARRSAFETSLVGDGRRDVPPTSPLNRERALFMQHGINGLDDLLFIVMFGAHPYAQPKSGGGGAVPSVFERAALDDIFSDVGRADLFCRHADPAAARAAHGAAFNGQKLAFANPIGIYIHSFAAESFEFRGEPVPMSWVQHGRGAGEGLFQRLVFGPPDDEDVFLDEITVDGAPLEGGYQLLERTEVGPVLLAGAPVPPTREELVVVGRHPTPVCGSARACADIKKLEMQPPVAQATGVRAARTGRRAFG